MPSKEYDSATQRTGARWTRLAGAAGGLTIMVTLPAVTSASDDVPAVPLLLSLAVGCLLAGVAWIGHVITHPRPLPPSVVVSAVLVAMSYWVLPSFFLLVLGGLAALVLLIAHGAALIVGAHRSGTGPARTGWVIVAVAIATLTVIRLSGYPASDGSFQFAMVAMGLGLGLSAAALVLARHER